MAAAGTTQIALGFSAPEFKLPDTVSGEDRDLQELKGDKATV
ncbi:MAG: thioredoxin family protein, partial [Bacteroidetes bacterium]|nr:thioredoxin family protein [Bacteroidota bacterium]